MHICRITITLGAALAALLTALSPAQAGCGFDPVDLLPAGGDCDGVTRDGEALTAYTYEELAEIINGAAGFYMQYGFEAAAFQNYLADVPGGPATVSLNLFHQGTAENAAALYQDPESGTGALIADWGGTGEARLNVGLYYQTIQFHEECYFGSLLVISLEEEGRSAIRCLGETICEDIQEPTSVGSTTWGSIKALLR